MIERHRRRLIVLAVAVVGSALLQACAVTTGPFVPGKSTPQNRSMTSQYDVLKQGGGPRQYRTVPTTRQKGLFDYRYY